MLLTIDEVRRRKQALDAAIDNTEMLLDAAAVILEEARTERKTLERTIERMQLEDAVEFPSEIYR